MPLDKETNPRNCLQLVSIVNTQYTNIHTISNAILGRHWNKNSKQQKRLCYVLITSLKQISFQYCNRKIYDPTWSILNIYVQEKTMGILQNPKFSRQRVQHGHLGHMFKWKNGDLPKPQILKIKVSESIRWKFYDNCAEVPKNFHKIDFWKNW